MSVAGEMASEINELVPELKRGSVAVFGDIFGGRIDNIHAVTSAVEVSPNQLRIQFDNGETLDVWEPTGATFASNTFQITSAMKVRWEWFYYGRPRTPQNRFYVEHVRDADGISASSDAGWAGARFYPSDDRPAVQLVGFEDSL